MLGKILRGIASLVSSDEEVMDEGITAVNLIDQELQDKADETHSAMSYNDQMALGTVFSTVAKNKQEIIKEVDSISNFYLVDVIISLLVEDALNPDITTGEILEVKSKNKKVNAELLKLDEKFRFDNLVREVTPEMLRYGEFIYKTKVGAKGLEEISDNIAQEAIVPISRRGEILFYIEINEKGKIVVKEVSDYLRFTYGFSSIRIDLSSITEKSKSKKIKEIPRFIRIGKSVLYPVIDKLKDLQLLEKLIPATKLAKLSSGSLIGTQVPANMDPTEAFKACRKIEGLLNKKVGLDTENKELSIANIISSFGRLKVVPIFGDKGSLNKMDYKTDEPDDLLQSIEDLRKVICTSIGYPYEILFGDDNGKKGELLKRYARYLTKLRNIQTAITNGIKELCVIHLVNSNTSFKESDIEVTFRNKLLEINNTESLEFLDMTISWLDNINRFITEMKDNEAFEIEINEKPWKDFLNTNLGLAGIEKLIKSIKKPTESEEEEDEDY